MVRIKTYQDLLEVGEIERDRMEFVLNAIREHKASTDYQTARDAELYYKHQNPTIMRYEKYVYNQMGKAVKDVWSPNSKIASNWYNYFTVQAVQFLLGNGVSFTDKATKDKLGKNFDNTVQEAATHAKNGGVSFGFWNYDHLEVYSLLEFVPLYDEENGALMAGIRFWQIDDTKPLRATLFELDGYTDYIKRKDEDIEVKNEKRKYIQITKTSEADGERIFDGDNYDGFPIIPFYNTNKQSDIIGNQGTIDAYDLMQSQLVNNVSRGELIYWILKNCGGMNAEDDAKFIEQLFVTHVAHADGDDGASVDAHTLSVPFEASAEALDRLKKQLFDDFMALDVSILSAGSVTATQIISAYEPLNQKTDGFEFNTTEFIKGILAIANIDDEPSYTRSQMSNQTEIIENVIKANEYLDSEYITQKILTVLGDADKVEEIMKRLKAEEIGRYKDDEIAELRAMIEELRKINNQSTEPIEEPIEE